MDDGILIFKEKEFISYPEDGNNLCFQLEDDSFWFNHRNKIILDQFNNQAVQGFVLDIGGGNGFVTKMLQESGYDVILVEPNFSGCLNAKHRGVKNIINSSLDQISFSELKPNCICAFDVLEHIENDFHFLKNCFNNLSVDGKLILSVPAFKGLWSNEDVLAGHYRRYAKHELESIVIKAGFNITYSSYFFSILPIAILIFRKIFSKKNNKIDDHSHRRNFLVLDLIFSLERSILRKRGKLFFGSSLILVAEKR